MSSSNYRPLNVDGNGYQFEQSHDQRREYCLNLINKPGSTNANLVIQDDQVSLVSQFTTQDTQTLGDESFHSYVHQSFFGADDQPSHSRSVSGADSVFTSTQREDRYYPLDSDISQERLTPWRRFAIPRKAVPSTLITPVSAVTSPTRPKAAYTEDIELLPLQYDDPTTLDQSVPDTPKEWKPIMLRKLPAALLILSCIVIALLLEGLEFISHKHQGFSTEDKNLVQLARYLPTVAVICLGFAWKSLVWDLKIITPFSVLSGTQTVKSKQSMELDYVDSLEFIAVWRSAKNRHWAVFLGLVVGLLCGILVPLASSLTFIDLYSPVQLDTTIEKNTQFSFQDSLATANGTLNIPWDYRGSQPYAAVFSSNQVNGKVPPWTVHAYAFESFNTTKWTKQNATVSATVQAFNAPFECQPIRYGFSKAEFSSYLSANDDDLRAANCELAVPQLTGIPWASSYSYNDMGWLNLTDCSNDGSDIRMLATVVMQPLDSNMTGSEAIGMLCRPRYFLREIEIQVNGSTGDILSLTETTKEPINIDIGTSLPVVVTYLNNPTDMASQLAYVVNVAGPHTTFKIPQATFENVTIYARTYDSRDVFFNQLYTGDRRAADYVLDPTLLAKEVVDYTNSLLTQVMSSFARKDASNPVDGFVVMHESRLRVRQSLLRAMQGILAFMAIICGLCCTILRPKSRLTEDPSSIAAVSVLLTSSEEEIEQKLVGATASDNSLRRESPLTAWRWLLQYSRQGAPSLFTEKEEKWAATSGRNKPLRPSSFNIANSQPIGLEGYKPLPFRMISRAILLLVVSAVIVALVILLHVSTKNGGFVAETSALSTAWSIIPTTLLVLLGYSIASVHAVLQSFTPYLALRKTSRSGSVFSNATSSVLTLPIHAVVRFGSAALLITSLIAFLFPAVKILAAGLYLPSASLKTTPVQVKIDTSLTDLFEAMYTSFPTENYVTNTSKYTAPIIDAMVVQASQFSEWTSIPYFGLPHRAGALDNLIFANLTAIKDVTSNGTSDLGTSIKLRTPAIAVTISCTSFGPEHFYTSVTNTGSSSYSSYSFWPRCKTAVCNSTLGGGPSQSKFTWTKSSLAGKTTGRYLGEASVGGNSLYRNISTFNTPYTVFIGEFPGLTLDFKNQTVITSQNRDTQLAPGMFSPLPTDAFPRVSAVSCTKSLHEITVLATFTKSSMLTLNGTKIFPWSISSYDNSSQTTIREYDPQTPLWAYPKHTPASQYNDDSDSILIGDSLFPVPARPFNIFELIAVWQNYQSGAELEKILEPASLATAVQKVWTSYLVEMITELRPHTSSNATLGNNTIMTLGTMSTPMIRMKQNREITIAVCSVLGLMLLGLLFVFVSFPKESFLMASPTSLGVTMGLLAGSRFVAGLRRDGVRSVKDLQRWKDCMFRLGWWPVLDEIGREGWRWGIDVVEDEKVEFMR